MRLKSLTLKGFKSFPERTTLSFAKGVSVIVGPNGSGKSNITDAVLWALGEQSPLAVRGQSMQDVIFSGGHGVKQRRLAEVEVVLDNSDGHLPLEFAEVSILRRLDRGGEGEYRLNGARCRLVDVIELLSDTGLGKEMHSIVSQGRVESIVNSKPRERRLLIEEAAGLGKHRKRRRRAQLKLERTRQNLDRALEVEREARTRLRPLKRQAEAAELHTRLERQRLEAESVLGAERLRVVATELASAEAATAEARSAREVAERELAGVRERREQIERRFAERVSTREALSSSFFSLRSAAELIEARREQVTATAGELEHSTELRRAQLEALPAPQEDAPVAEAERVATLERELAELEAQAAVAAREASAGLEAERATAEGRAAELAERATGAEAALERAEADAAGARETRRGAEQALEQARRAHSASEAELRAADDLLRSGSALSQASRALERSGASVLAGQLRVEPGYERAVAAALGGRLGAALAPDLPAAVRLLEGLGEDAGRALVAGGRPAESRGDPPVGGAERLLDRIEAAGEAAPLVERLLADAWVVEDLAGLPRDFDGIAVTRSGRGYHGAAGELRQAPAGGDERLLAERNRRDALAGACDQTGVALEAAEREAERAQTAVPEADRLQEQAEAALREVRREREQALEEARRAQWLAEQRRAAEAEGPAALRQARLEAELAGARQLAERAEHERSELERRRAALAEAVSLAEGLLPAARALEGALRAALEATAERRDAAEGELGEDQEEGGRIAAELRELSASEAAAQEAFKTAAEAHTELEVSAAQARDRCGEAERALGEVATALGLELSAAESPLTEEERERQQAAIGRLERRREQLGPVNPLAADEYAEAREHTDDLKRQREDAEGALRELQGLIRDTDRVIRESFEETFEAAARNFADLIGQLFPGGSGRLRLVKPDGPRPVLGGAQGEEAASGEGEPGDGGDPGEEEDVEQPEVEMPGVEVEVTPGGKSMRRMSLLSGGEKSMVAIGFIFAVFLARPCPFYILDEVEAALDDVNIARFLELVRRYSGETQFIVITHQKRTMEAADVLYGVSMGGDGVTKVVSRRLGEATAEDEEAAA